MIHTGTAEHSCTICLGLSMTEITWQDGQDRSPDPYVLHVRLVIMDGISVICKIKEDFPLPLLPAAEFLLLHLYVSLPSPQGQTCYLIFKSFLDVLLSVSSPSVCADPWPPLVMFWTQAPPTRYYLFAGQLHQDRLQHRVLHAYLSSTTQASGGS